MIDFTSALYLGMRHESGSLRPWGQLTTGAPAALTSQPGASAVAQEVAALQDCERGVLAPSTLHLFWDLFGILSREKVAIYVDEGIYPIARWGVERAAAQGVSVKTFPCHDADGLQDRLREDRHRRGRPVVVSDGLCPACGKVAPIAAYLDSMRVFGGYLILDDTQALGILGHAPGPAAPYGKGGGGSLRWSDVSGPDLLVVSSLAKGFGVPVAVLSGSRATVGHFEAKSETRVHCSPPSMAVIHAAAQALEVNDGHGDPLRLRLALRVRYFRDKLLEIGLSTGGGPFPVQTLLLQPDINVIFLYERLIQLGIRTVLHRNRNGNGARISFIVTALHSQSDIIRAVDVLSYALMRQCANR
ncbi:MAG: pyridoxal phosphate-dependent aminotransferase family protein [Candidatus Methylomirabilis oxyfera]|nr:pyridoxal phosphate-dependent aminotransferase family protein [Candidatus Methylomirabilis oxyfera]